MLNEEPIFPGEIIVARKNAMDITNTKIDDLALGIVSKLPRFMNVSFNGLRRNATYAMNELWDILNTVLDEDTHQDIDVDLKQKIIEKFNQAAMYVDSFNCLYDDSVEGDMDNLSDLSISRLEDLEENEEDE